MRVVYTLLARRDIASIRAYIETRSPAGASKVVLSLISACESLEVFPERARPGREPGTRELVVWPYVIVYRVTGEAVEILRVWHGAQNR